MIVKMGSAKIEQGTVPFKHPTLPKECWTWFEVHGDLTDKTAGPPLVLLHGGPGMSHNYLLSLADLAQTHGIPVVFYDQIGCGNSTHLREKRLDESFWTVDLFIAELENLLQHLDIADSFDLLGQSWGGLLATCFAVKGHPGLNKLVISNSPASLELWLRACNGYRHQLPTEVNQVLEECEKRRDFNNTAYKDACMVWYNSHMCRTQPWPDYVLKTFETMDEDDTVYYTMNGPSEFTVIGSLTGFSLVGKLAAVTVPSLILNGEYDSADAEAIAPFLKEMTNIKSHTFPDCSHMCHVEDREGYLGVLADFLKESSL